MIVIISDKHCRYISYPVEDTSDLDVSTKIPGEGGPEFSPALSSSSCFDSLPFLASLQICYGNHISSNEAGDSQEGAKPR